MNMNGRATHDPRQHLFARRCVCCGHDGPDIQIESAELCPACGCDLIERPPRSYAEMEGLTGAMSEPAGPRHVADYWSYKSAPIERSTARSLERWLLFLFFWLLVLFAAMGLASVAMGA